MMTEVNPPSKDRRVNDPRGDSTHIQLITELKEYSIEKFDAGVARMLIIEDSIAKNTRATMELNARFDSFETLLQTERRVKDAALAKNLEEWKGFTITKFDENATRVGAIEENQSKHMKSTEVLQAGIGDVLTIVTALSGAKKTLGWIGKIGLWAGGLAGAWIAIRTAMSTNIKVWPW